MLRFDENKISFRLDQHDLEQLLSRGSVITNHLFFEYGIALADTPKLEFHNNKLMLYVTKENCSALKANKPSKDGINFQQDDFTIYLMLNIRSKLSDKT